MTIRSLAQFREEQKAVRTLEVRRVLAENTQGVLCKAWRYYAACGRPTEYFVCTIGSKVGQFVCGDCLERVIRKRLIAPPEEVAERQRETANEHLAAAERAAREQRRKAHRGCAGYTEADPDNLCRRPPVGACGNCLKLADHERGLYGMTTVPGPGASPTLYCARHILGCKKRHAARLLPVAAVVS